MSTQPERHRPTIRDVATAAGVSRATVSRVLNGGHWVSPEAAGRVQAAVRETGYVANVHARGLAMGRANSVAFLLGEPQRLLFEDPNFATLLRSVADELGRRRLSFILMTTDNPQEEARNLAYLQAGHADGVLLVSWHAGAARLIRSLVAAQVPTVVAEQPPRRSAGVGYVHVDDFESARMAAQCLVSAGAQRIAMIAGPKGPSGTGDRIAGFLDVVGQDYDRGLIVHGDYSSASGEDAAQRLLDDPRYSRPNGRPAVDGIFASSDAMAAGALKVIRERGWLVPDDIQLIGFDDSPFATITDPPLTTIRQPFEEIGRRMVVQLVDMIDGGPCVGTVLTTTLVERGSTRAQASVVPATSVE
ncbi:DNA-binding transcriptional regulator, LacI/PurR family [Propionibacterium cyclohexanicum]|uniref:DNA-binding transcriptional regulator, LacI/PurR family n=1 Tax=Propionibacterium cyclohexanicum TaxID=64702 RepID=A0A1H9PSD8_9ACTN|nr:LacI family DNA-binding transcriptional regulator [Propionibacterium cyclohexanicum]SER51102.1 DNA-binding transcriptional regulator, LacI/PurR family [Propionibacterium cyclohexanicum]